MKVINQPGENHMKHHMMDSTGAMLCTGKPPAHPQHWNERAYSLDVERFGSSRWHCQRCARKLAAQ